MRHWYRYLTLVGLAALVGCTASTGLLVLNVRESARLVGCDLSARADTLGIDAVTDSLANEVTIGLGEGLAGNCGGH